MSWRNNLKINWKSSNGEILSKYFIERFGDLGYRVSSMNMGNDKTIYHFEKPLSAGDRKKLKDNVSEFEDESDGFFKAVVKKGLE